MTRPSPYSPEFREEAVQLALKSSKPIAQVARELDMNPETLRTWVRRYKHEHRKRSEPARHRRTGQAQGTRTRTSRTPHGERIPEKSRSVLRPGSPVAEKYEFIDSCRASDAKYAYPVKKMCTWLSVSASGFFDWRQRSDSATARRRERLCALIREAFESSDETYGYRRIHAQLARWGVPCGPELVRGIMRELGLWPCQPRPWRASLTEQDGRAHHIPDLVARDFTAERPGQKFVGDITYIPTWEGWLYLATVIDCHTKMVVGYAMDDNYKTPLIVEALTQAARPESSLPDAIFHSDRGSNYMSGSSPRPSTKWACANRSAGPESATITLWPNHSSAF